MAGEAAERPGPPTGRRDGRQTALSVSVVCLSGTGGPVLAGELRRLWSRSPNCTVRLVVPKAAATAAPMLIGDPLSGAYWPCSPPVCDPDEDEREAQLRMRALRWFLWEMGVDADAEVCDASPLSALLGEAEEHRADAVVVAASTARRWRGTVRDLVRRARSSSVEVRVALDRRC